MLNTTPLTPARVAIVDPQTGFVSRPWYMFFESLYQIAQFPIPNKTPASATAAGTQGEVCWDTNYIYVCVATNTWKRTAISTW
jgi:hypothetical protein